jgi:colanic acid biosynthesis glycosyl transferase WcaI
LRILILSQYYDPEPIIYPHQLAKGLLERGHKVTVITGYPNYPRGKVYPEYKQKLWQWDTLDGIRILRLPLFPDHSLSRIRRAVCYLSFALSSSMIAPFLKVPADIYFVFEPITLGIPAFLISTFKKKPFVYNVQDMYPESMLTINIPNKSIIYKSIDKYAKFVYHKASAISVISQGFKRNIVSKGVPEHKIHIIHNWADDNIYKPVPRDEGLAEKYGLKGRFNVIYAGNMGPPQGLENVIKAAAGLTDIPEFQFVLIGDGNERIRLEKSVRDRNLTNVRFISRQPGSQMPFFYALADGLLVHLLNNPLFDITIPSKTQSYLACGRPIIMSVGGDAAHLVEEAGAGVIARPSDPGDLARAVRALYGMVPADRDAMGISGRNYYLTNLTAKIQIEKYEDIFKEIISNYLV